VAAGRTGGTILFYAAGQNTSFGEAFACRCFSLTAIPARGDNALDTFTEGESRPRHDVLVCVPLSDNRIGSSQHRRRCVDPCSARKSLELLGGHHRTGVQQRRLIGRQLHASRQPLAFLLDAQFSVTKRLPASSRPGRIEASALASHPVKRRPARFPGDRSRRNAASACSRGTVPSPVVGSTRGSEPATLRGGVRSRSTLRPSHGHATRGLLRESHARVAAGIALVSAGSRVECRSVAHFDLRWLVPCPSTSGRG
jgi:hypothetical protein